MSEILLKKCQYVFDQIGRVSRPSSLFTPSEKRQLKTETPTLDTATTMQRAWHILHPNTTPACRCGAAVGWRKQHHAYSTFCSSKCAHVYGDIQERKEQTNIEKYGCKSPFGNKEVQLKAAKTVQSRYHVQNVSQITSVRESKRKKMTHSTNTTEINLYKTHIDNKLTQKEIGDLVQPSQVGVHHKLRRLNLKTLSSTMSSTQRQITEFIQSLGEEVQSNTSNQIPPYELDILVPARSIAVEVNGVYWHSELAGRDNKYHLSKYNECRKRGIRLIQILDSDWINNRIAVESRLKNLFQPAVPYHGRKCDVHKISASTANDFCVQYHTQGKNTAKHNYGLYHNGELLSVMTFSLSRFSTHYQYEMVRYCVKPNTTIHGGVNKLVNRFVASVNPKSIGTYADLRWGDGSTYKRAGFTFQHNTKPGYQYFNRQGNVHQLFNRVVFQKHKLKDKLATFDSQKTAWENMVINGYDRIWDCGHALWIWKNCK